MRYQRRENLGAGLALAWDEKLNRSVLLQSGMGDLALRGAALAGVHHRHILRVLDYMPGAGRDHIVFEAPRGASLAQAAPSAAARQKMGWAIQTCHALECLARRGLGPDSLELSLVFLDDHGQIKLLPGKMSPGDVLPAFGHFLAELFSAGGKRVPVRIARIIHGCRGGRLTMGQVQGLLHDAARPRGAEPARLIHGVGVGRIGCLPPEGGWVLPAAGGVLAFLDLRVGLGLVLPWGVWTIAKVDPAGGICLAVPLLFAFPYVIGKGSKLTLLLCLSPVLCRLGLGYSSGWLAGWLWGPIAGALVGAGGCWLHLILSRVEQTTLPALLLEMIGWWRQILAASLAPGAVGLVRGRRWGIVLLLGLTTLLTLCRPGLWDPLQLPGLWLLLLLWQRKGRQIFLDFSK